MKNTFKHALHSFTGWMLRMKNIDRWPLMYSIRKENCATHSFETGVVGHIIAVIGVEKYGKKYNPADIMVACIYHEASEAGGLGDTPHPVKYANPILTREFKKLEHEVENSMVGNALPDYLQKHFSDIVIQKQVDKDIKVIVKAADDIVAFLKAHQELRLHNDEFESAGEKLRNKIITHCQDYPEVAEFARTQLPLCMTSLDKLVTGAVPTDIFNLDELHRKAS